MSDIDKYIANKAKTEPDIYLEIAKEKAYLNAAVAVHDFRKKQGLSQRDFAKFVGKPQSTIAQNRKWRYESFHKNFNGHCYQI